MSAKLEKKTHKADIFTEDVAGNIAGPTQRYIDRYIDKQHDEISSPRHYTWHPVAECNDIIQEFDANIAQAMKYLWRYKHKGARIKDLKKSIQKIKQEIQRLERIEQIENAPKGA